MRNEADTAKSSLTEDVRFEAVYDQSTLHGEVGLVSWRAESAKSLTKIAIPRQLEAQNIHGVCRIHV